MATTNQKLQMKEWKVLHREDYLQYCKNYYMKNKGNGKWVNPPPTGKPRAPGKPRARKPTKGWRDINALERYKFPKIKPKNALPAERGWIAGRPPGAGNRPKCFIIGCEKKEGVVTVRFD